MYAHLEKSKENKSRAVANSIGQKKRDKYQGFEYADNRQESIAQRRLQNIINLSAKITQTRSDKRIESSARKHYNDGWGAKYGIQDDESLKDQVPDSVKGDGTITLGVFAFHQWVYKGDIYQKGKHCTIKYQDRIEGWGKSISKYTSIYHCGPTGEPLIWKLE